MPYLNSLVRALRWKALRRTGEQAERVGLHRNSLVNIESGHRPASMGIAQKIADDFGVGVEVLIDRHRSPVEEPVGQGADAP